MSAAIAFEKTASEDRLRSTIVTAAIIFMDDFRPCIDSRDLFYILNVRCSSRAIN